MALAEYLRDPNSKKILLAMIDPDGPNPIAISDRPYRTEPGDAPGHIAYHPIIAENGVPTLDRQAKVLKAAVTPSWGPLLLTTFETYDVSGAPVNLASADYRGKKIELRITGPRDKVPFSDSVIILTCYILRQDGSADGGPVIEVGDRTTNLEKILIPLNRYDSATEAAGFPPSNHGRIRPLCFGDCYNITPVLTNAATREYEAADASYWYIYNIPAVYDNRVPVAYTPVPGNQNRFTLDIAPTNGGFITCDVQGHKVLGGSYAKSTREIANKILVDLAGISWGDLGIENDLPTTTAGIFINHEENIKSVINRLLESAGCIGYISRLGKYVGKKWVVPESDGPIIGRSKHLGDVKWVYDDEVLHTQPLLYKKNWTQVEPALSVDLDDAQWVRSEGSEEPPITDPAILAAYDYAVSAERHDTLYSSNAGNAELGGRILALRGQPRKTVFLSAPISGEPLDITDSVELRDTPIDGDYIVIGVRNRWAGPVPLVDLVLWG